MLTPILKESLIRSPGEASTSAFRDNNAIVDIKGTFDQVTGLETDNAKIFRLYNAAFKRLPDADGLKYWIKKYTSGENDDRAVGQSFLVSDEFAERYGATSRKLNTSRLSMSMF